MFSNGLCGLQHIVLTLTLALSFLLRETSQERSQAKQDTRKPGGISFSWLKQQPIPSEIQTWDQSQKGGLQKRSSYGPLMIFLVKRIQGIPTHWCTLYFMPESKLCRRFEMCLIFVPERESLFDPTENTFSFRNTNVRQVFHKPNWLEMVLKEKSNTGHKGYMAAKSLFLGTLLEYAAIFLFVPYRCTVLPRFA